MLSKGSFAIDEAPSPLRALSATLIIDDKQMEFNSREMILMIVIYVSFQVEKPKLARTKASSLFVHLMKKWSVIKVNVHFKGFTWLLQ